jgi:tetratricopeptide (TPR) repeat protein
MEACCRISILEGGDRLPAEQDRRCHPYFLEYLKSGAVNGEVNPTDARYNLGYCFLKKENYRQAQGFFEQVVRTPRLNSSSPLEQDAYIRDADCYYMNRDYKTALTMYNKVIDFPGRPAIMLLFRRR